MDYKLYFSLTLMTYKNLFTKEFICKSPEYVLPKIKLLATVCFSVLFFNIFKTFF